MMRPRGSPGSAIENTSNELGRFRASAARSAKRIGGVSQGPSILRSAMTRDDGYLAPEGADVICAERGLPGTPSEARR